MGCKITHLGLLCSALTSFSACAGDEASSDGTETSTGESSGAPASTTSGDTTDETSSDSSGAGSGEDSTAAPSGGAASYQGCATDDDCSLLGEMCLAVAQAPESRQCRAPCEVSDDCPFDEYGTQGMCVDDGFCGLYCADSLGGCDVLTKECAYFSPAAPDGICIPL